ncbi:uncharacterized protein LOC117112651 [Anneissia japonica]|uniref:uncharacterized protein LOC117112651 n=1 Tax=Anneissia japonica TaxID=1529436 RepID=UPI0014257216|nr:uncharacterized protein LOC117112651 [Anneissia japonica]
MYELISQRVVTSRKTLPENLLEQQFEDSRGTELHEAIDLSDWSTVRQITEEHPELLSVQDDKFGYTPLIQILRSEEAIPRDVVATIASKTPTSAIDTKYQRGWTALQLAAHKGFVDIVNVLIANGADKDIQMKKGVTALFVSAQNGHADVCKVLIDSGADMHIQQEDGWTTLMTAAHFNQYDTVELLLNAKVDVNQVNTDGGTALHAAAFLGYASVVKLLLDYGALVLQTKDGNTPLHSCFLNQRLSYDQHRKVTVAFMITGHRDIVSIKNSKGKTAINLYKEHKSQKYETKRRSEQKEELLNILKGGSLPDINFKPTGRSIPAIISAHGPAADKVYNKALEEGTVEVNLGRIKVIGQERVGKTSLINACLGKPFNPHEKTTNAIATTKIVTKRAEEPSKWEENLTESGSATEMYQKLMAETVIRHTVENCGAEIIEETPSEKIQTTPVTPTENPRKISDTEAGTTKEELIQSEVRNPREQIHVLETEPKMPRIPRVIRNQVDEGFRKGIYYKKQGLGEWHNIGEETFNIWDYGGQLIYHGIHKIFMTFMAVYIVVFNLESCLDEHAIVQDSSGKEYPHLLTNLKFIIYWIESVYTHSRQLIDDMDEDIDLPAIVLVGTHRDSLGDNEEERDRKVKEAFKKISNELEGKPYESHVYHKYFDIENNCQEIDKTVFELKNVLEVLMKTLVKPVPLKWMYFRCELQQLRDENLVCSLQKSTQGKVCNGPDKDELDCVCLKPKRPVNGFINAFIHGRRQTRLLSKTYRTSRFKASIRKLNKTGILEEKLLKTLWRKSGIDLNNFDTFVDLMKQFSFLCDRKTPEASDGAPSFFVPLRLALEPPTSGKQRDVDSYGTRAISIFHGFRGYLPDELFPMIVTEFINRFKGEAEPELAHDRAELYLDQYHHVVLSVVTFNRQRMLKTTILRREAINEVKISLDREPSSKACKTVCKDSSFI